MMRTTDTATQSPSCSEAQAVESAQALPALKDDRLSLPLSPRSSEVPYAVRLLAISSTVGISAILLGQGLWQPDTKAARLPMPEGIDVNRPSLPSLRDRVSVTTLPSSAVSPPESLPSPINATRQNQLKSSTELPTVRISHGFGNAGQQTLAAALPVPALPVPTAPVPETPPSIAAQPQALPAPRQIPLHSANQPAAVIASLLQAPQPPASATPGPEAVAVVPRSTAPIEQAEADRNPSQAALTGIRDTSKQPAPTALPTLSTAASTQITAIQPTPMELTRIPLEGSDIEPLTITGNTRFSSKELVDVVEKAIVGKAERLSISYPPTVNRSFSPAELLQAREAITQFYVAHGYTNVKVYVPADGLNGATPIIQIVENTVETIDRLSVHQ